MNRLGAAVVVLLLGAAGCGSAGGADSATVTVFAAASLTESFTALGADFEAARPGVRVRFNFGSSATLAQQITRGAPADVFAAASPATMKTVTEAGLATDPATFARNRLEIAVPPANGGGVTGLKDLADPKIKVALCAEQVPCGAAARTALAAAGVTVEPVTLEQDVKATLTKVRLGEVDAALVYRTDVLAAGDRVKGIPFPEAARAVNDYPIVALAGTPETARQWVAFVLSPRGRQTLLTAGFEAP